MKCASNLPLALMLQPHQCLDKVSRCPHTLILPNVLSGLKWSKSAAFLLELCQRTMLISSPRSVDFRMTNFLPHEIVNAEITAHAFSYKLRSFSVPAPTPDLAKTVDVAFNVKGNSSASRELSFAHFPPVRTFDVNSVTYADGSTWHASSPGICSVAPSAAMRISAH